MFPPFLLPSDLESTRCLLIHPCQLQRTNVQISFTTTDAGLQKRTKNLPPTPTYDATTLNHHILGDVIDLRQRVRIIHTFPAGRRR